MSASRRTPGPAPTWFRATPSSGARMRGAPAGTGIEPPPRPPPPSDIAPARPGARPITLNWRPLLPAGTHRAVSRPATTSLLRFRRALHCSGCQATGLTQSRPLWLLG